MAFDVCDKWKEAIDEEKRSIRDHHIYTLMNKPPSSRILNTRWVFAKKYNKQGELERYKA